MSRKINFLPKLIITDIDGVWTDGGMYYDQNGNELKKFHTYDSAGILFCKLNNIKTAIVTGEDTQIVSRRSMKLGVDYLFQAGSNKVEIVTNLCKSLGVDISEVAYIGDDLNDIKLFQIVGFSACPRSAPDYIKSRVSKVMSKNGGNGVFREFVEEILIDNEIFELTLEKFISEKN